MWAVGRSQPNIQWRTIVLVSLLLLISPFAANASSGKGFVVDATTVSGGKEKVHLYDNSYALLIGAGHYTAGWPSLDSVNKEMDQLQEALERNGFSVTRVNDPNGKKLEAAFDDFIDRYGYQSGNRLLFYFSGHGYTRKEGDKGYLVPVDAPDPEKDTRGFLRKAVAMSDVLAWARKIEAKHVLFMFDSCFSGTVFKQKNFEKPPEHIRKIAAKPVRQFITAGSAGETVPAQSTFTPAFIDAIVYGRGDLNKDGYISGMELGLHLQQEVPRHVRQTPQYGKISDYNLSRGDFIFLAGSDPDNVSSSGPAASQPQYRVNAEEELWLAVKESADLADFETYLSEYPSGRFAPVARVKIRALKEQGSPPAASVAPAGPKAGDTYTDPTTGMEFVYVPGGCYQMGDSFGDGYSEEKPLHEVCVDGFYMGKYEVTNEQYRRYQSSYSSQYSNGISLDGDSQPVLFVSWDDVLSYANWLSQKTGKQYRLPTEAEWEYAARGRTSTARHWGDNPDGACTHANVHDLSSKRTNTHLTGEHHNCDDGYAVTAPAGSFKPNGFGLYDMLGNVWEWCSDWFGKNYYSLSPKNNPTGPSSGDERVIRGGSYYNSPRGTRSATRFRKPPGYRGTPGFRLLLQANAPGK